MVIIYRVVLFLLVTKNMEYQKDCMADNTPFVKQMQGTGNGVRPRILSILTMFLKTVESRKKKTVKDIKISGERGHGERCQAVIGC